jgi:hypothetical protein
MTGINAENTGADRPKPTAQGCSLLTLLVLASFWVLGGTALVLVFTWTVEQAILDASFVVSDVRFFVFLAFGGIMVFALLIVTLWTRLPHMKAVFRTWMLAAILALILAPVRLLPILAGQLTALFQMAGLLLFILGLWLLLVRPAVGVSAIQPSKSGWRGVEIALIIAFIIGIPWVWIGAFGSILDTLLALGVALLFGIAASILLSHSLLRDITADKLNYSNVDYATDGFAAAMTLLILVTALGQNGNQWVLVLVVPVLGWAAVGVAAIGRHLNASRNWPSMAVMIGLAIAWPLMLVEPTELSLRLTGSPGELTGWILRAAQYSLWLALLINVGVAILLRKMLAGQYPSDGWRSGRLYAGWL